MKTRLLQVVFLAGAACATGVSAQETRLAVTRVGDAIQLSFETVQGMLYEVQISTDLAAWIDSGLTKTGDGLTALQEITDVTGTARFFRLAVREAPSDLAPTTEQMIDLLVGEELFGYSFTSATRFEWPGYPGNWSYQKTGPDTGLLVFTYDEDGNNPQVYREEIVLTFTSALAGTYRYAEFEEGIERPWSVEVGPFDLDTTPEDLAPTADEITARLVGSTWEGYDFISATRFEWPGYPGNWSYQKTGPNTGLLILTYDDAGNDPQVYREELLMTFVTATSGNYRYSEIYEGEEDPESIFVSPFTLP